MRIHLRERSRIRPDRRPGFTLVELLVSMALTLFLMTILVEAFSAGMETFSGLRSLGELQSNLRTALTTMQRDLAMDHFEGERRLSDPNFWSEPRREGFFFHQTAASGTSEGSDWTGLIPSARFTTDVLHFTVRRRGNRPEDFFTVNKVPAAFFTQRLTANNQPFITTYSDSSKQRMTSQWAEVVYFLMPVTAPNTTQAAEADPLAAGTFVPLFDLFRAQFMVLPFTDGVQTPSPQPQNTTTFFPQPWSKMASYYVGGPSPVYKFWSPNELAKSTTATRSVNFGAALNPIDVQRSSLLLSNVVSFEVRGLQAGAANFSRFVGDPSSATSTVFETVAYPPPATPRFVGIEVLLRVYDPASGLTRQATLLQDM